MNKRRRNGQLSTKIVNDGPGGLEVPIVAAVGHSGETHPLADGSRRLAAVRKIIREAD